LSQCPVRSENCPGYLSRLYCFSIVFFFRNIDEAVQAPPAAPNLTPSLDTNVPGLSQTPTQTGNILPLDANVAGPPASYGMPK